MLSLTELAKVWIGLPCGCGGRIKTVDGSNATLSATVIPQRRRRPGSAVCFLSASKQRNSGKLQLTSSLQF